MCFAQLPCFIVLLVLQINVLETFGQLVFERIRVKSEEINAQMGSSKPLPGVEAVVCAIHCVYVMHCLCFPPTHRGLHRA